MRAEFEIRSLPTPLVMGFLAEAGGTLHGERAARAEGWSARLEEMPPAPLGPVSIRRDLLVIEGSDVEAVQRVVDFMRRSLMRGGG